jgi:thymidylate synthase
MKTIERDTIAQAHEEVIKQILLDGKIIMTKHGITQEYPEGIAIKVNHPMKEFRISTCSNFTEQKAKLYSKQLLSVIPKTGTNKDFDYNCGNRWFDYPQVDYLDAYIEGDGDGNGFNQVENMIINELNKDKSSRRAVICSINPGIDYFKTHIPCISFLQFLIRDEQINCEVYTRSNDMLSAWGADAYALSDFHNYISKQLNIEQGFIEIISISAHIYFKRDAPELLKFRKKINF